MNGWYVILNISVVIVGWVVLYTNAKRIATRAETRIILNNVLEKLNTLRTSATEYWLKEPGELSNGEVVFWTQKTLSELQLIDSSLQLLKRRNMNFDIINLFVHLRQQVTFGCEYRKKKSQEPDREKAVKLSESTHSIIEILEESFLDLYAPS